jgi:hypothetical protein
MVLHRPIETTRLIGTDPKKLLELTQQINDLLPSKKHRLERENGQKPKE